MYCYVWCIRAIRVKMLRINTTQTLNFWEWLKPVVFRFRSSGKRDITATKVPMHYGIWICTKSWSHNKVTLLYHIHCKMPEQLPWMRHISSLKACIRARHPVKCVLNLLLLLGHCLFFWLPYTQYSNKNHQYNHSWQCRMTSVYHTNPCTIAHWPFCCGKSVSEALAHLRSTTSGSTNLTNCLIVYITCSLYHVPS